jgi:outer membrane protein OmpA-like peptidoglycan-associated protein
LTGPHRDKRHLWPTLWRPLVRRGRVFARRTLGLSRLTASDGAGFAAAGLTALAGLFVAIGLTGTPPTAHHPGVRDFAGGQLPALRGATEAETLPEISLRKVAGQASAEHRLALIGSLSGRQATFDTIKTLPLLAVQSRTAMLPPDSDLVDGEGARATNDADPELRRLASSRATGDWAFLGLLSGRYSESIYGPAPTARADLPIPRLAGGMVPSIQVTPTERHRLASSQTRVLRPAASAQNPTAATSRAMTRSASLPFDGLIHLVGSQPSAPVPLAARAGDSIATPPSAMGRGLPPAGSASHTFSRRASILFAGDGIELTADARDKLAKLAPSLPHEGRIQLVAYAGQPGEKSSMARRKALKRGQNVRNALVAEGIPVSRIEVRALGGVAEGPAQRVDVLLPAR